MLMAARLRRTIQLTTFVDVSHREFRFRAMHFDYNAITCAMSWMIWCDMHLKSSYTDVDPILLCDAFIHWFGSSEFVRTFFSSNRNWHNDETRIIVMNELCVCVQRMHSALGFKLSWTGFGRYDIATGHSYYYVTIVAVKMEAQSIGHFHQTRKQ